MSTKEEVHKAKNFEFSHSFMGKYFNHGTEEKKGEKFNFESCEQMMKKFCAAKDEKFDCETFQSKMAKCFEGTSEAPCGKPQGILNSKEGAER